MVDAARDSCPKFGTSSTKAVQNNGIAVAAPNEVVLAGLKQAVNSVVGGSYKIAKTILEYQILPTMMLIREQSNMLLSMLVVKRGCLKADSRILPIVDQSKSSSAGTIVENMEFLLLVQPLSDSFPTVAKAKRKTLVWMLTACSDIGGGDFEDDFVAAIMLSSNFRIIGLKSRRFANS